jgi:hypothetical protein
VGARPTSADKTAEMIGQTLRGTDLGNSADGSAVVGRESRRATRWHGTERDSWLLARREIEFRHRAFGSPDLVHPALRYRSERHRCAPATPCRPGERAASRRGAPTRPPTTSLRGQELEAADQLPATPAPPPSFREDLLQAGPYGERFHGVAAPGHGGRLEERVVRTASSTASAGRGKSGLDEKPFSSSSTCRTGLAESVGSHRVFRR